MDHKDWLDIDILEDYLDGKLDAKSMHSVERMSLDDPFVAEALAGLTASRKRTQSLSLLQKQLQERIVQKPVTEKRWRITSQRLSIGAAAAVLFVVVSILFWMKQSPKKVEISENKKVETQVAPMVAEKREEEKLVDGASTIEAVKPKMLPENKVVVAKVKARPIETKVAVAASQPVIAAVRSMPDSVNLSRSKTVGDVQFVAIEGVKRTKVQSREMPLSAKAEGVRFNPNDLAKGKPGVLINGVVYEKPGGQPLPGAVISVAGTNKSTTTNARGEFSLPVDTGLQSLSIGYLGFTSKQLKTAAGESVKVGLEADDKALNEVLVVDKKKSVQPQPVPATGWNAFNAYLSTNNRLIKAEVKSNKQVTLSFNVNRDGRPSNINIIKGLTKLENEEAIRLIEEGPDWILPANARRKAEVVIHF